MADKSKGFMLFTESKCSATCPEVQKDCVIKGCLLGTNRLWLQLLHYYRLIWGHMGCFMAF